MGRFVGAALALVFVASFAWPSARIAAASDSSPLAAVRIGQFTSVRDVSAQVAADTRDARSVATLPLLAESLRATPLRPGAGPRLADSSRQTNTAASTSGLLQGPGWRGMDNSVNYAYAGCSPGTLCIEPPDPAVAVGSSYVVQTVNLAMRVYDRSGTALLTTSLIGMFGTQLEAGTSDPRSPITPQAEGG